MGSKRRSDSHNFDSESYDNYEDELDDDFDNIGDLSKDFYSADWEDPSRSKRRLNTRRRIERRNDLKELHSQFDYWDDYDLNNEW